MKRLYLAPFVLAALLGCNDSTSPRAVTNSQLPDLGTMNVGDVRVITFAQAKNGLTIPSTLSSAQYLIVAANVAGDTGSVPQYKISGDLRTATPGLKNSLSVPSPFARPELGQMSGTLGTRFLAKIRSYERANLRPSAYRATIARRKVSSLLRTDHVPLPSGTVPNVGDQYQFNVPKLSDSICTSTNGFTTVTATVKAVSNHAIVVLDNQSVDNGFADSTYASVAQEFDNYIYPTEVGYFGTPTDLDNNGRVYILYTPSVNLATPAGAADDKGYIGGFTFAGDLFDRVAPPSGCLESNETEIFYLMVPDPAGHFGNVFSTALVRQQTRVTMGHELQHAINNGTRLFNNAVGLESAWLDEALSSLAEDAIGRVELGGAGAGYGDLQTLTLSTMVNMDRNMYNTFFSENFARLQCYVLRPDTVGALVTDTREEHDLAAFGAGWAFLRYTVDWFSNNTPRTFTRALVAGPDTGTANLTSHAGASLDTLLAHWLVTMYTDGQNIPGLPAQYNYRTYNMRDIVSDLGPSPSCPSQSAYLPVTPVGDGTTSVILGVPSSSADYFITSLTTGGARTFTITNPNGTTAVNPHGRLYVVRLQ